MRNPKLTITETDPGGQRASYCSLASLTSEGKDKDRACEKPKFEVRKILTRERDKVRLILVQRFDLT